MVLVDKDVLTTQDSAASHLLSCGVIKQKTHVSYCPSATRQKHLPTVLRFLCAFCYSHLLDINCMSAADVWVVSGDGNASKGGQGKEGCGGSGHRRQMSDPPSSEQLPFALTLMMLSWLVRHPVITGGRRRTTGKVWTAPEEVVGERSGGHVCVFALHISHTRGTLEWQQCQLWELLRGRSVWSIWIASHPAVWTHQVFSEEQTRPPPKARNWWSSANL